MTKADLIAAWVIWPTVVVLAVMALVICVMNVREIIEDRRRRVEVPADVPDDG